LGDFETGKARFHYETLGTADGPHIIWAHGWGQDHTALVPLASSLEHAGHHTLIDFPGFGKSPPPPESWGTEDYADALAAWLGEQAIGPVLLVGHSFGCRVGLQLAAHYPALVSGLFLIAAAGLKRRRPVHQQLALKARVALYKTAKAILGPDKAAARFGSRNYKQAAGIMRGVFVKVVNEDLSTQARNIGCPVRLVYGRNDNETPPEIGARLAALIPHAEMVQLEGQDHYTVLDSGRHQVAHLLKQFIKETGSAP